MTRCVFAAAVSAALLLGACAAPAPDTSPTRRFAAHTLRGELAFTAPPEVLLNGQPTRLAPAARVRGPDDMGVAPSLLAGQRVVVNYTTDLMGQPLEIWLLRPSEAASVWPRSRAEAQAWAFDATTQTWRRP
ncbi:MAG: hypothetical protein LCH73_15060 [Proteobacteria bacterium]|nr:hypothetical protein [Pseudomonadota bacterium]